MKYYLYSSRSAFPNDDYSDIEILRTALSNNAVFGVTGFLHRTRTHFVQYFEGRGDLAERLWNNILADKRHYEVRLLCSDEIPYPKFSGWSMGYSDHLRFGGNAEINPEGPQELIISQLEEESERQLARFLNAKVETNALAG